VGIVFVVLSFLTLVFYGLWVASGVVAEKANRVMELLISARSPASA
jgi:ABC-type Na+ efflux pump permease subunit